MKPLTAEWVTKAEADYALALHLLHDAKSPNCDAVCFHAQQSAEKYIKAVLQEREQPIPRVHDLVHLAQLVVPPLAGLVDQYEDLAVLSQLAVSTRYPGYFADRDAAQQAVHAARAVRATCRKELGPTGDE